MMVAHVVDFTRCTSEQVQLFCCRQMEHRNVPNRTSQGTLLYLCRQMEHPNVPIIIGRMALSLCMVLGSFYLLFVVGRGLIVD